MTEKPKGYQSSEVESRWYDYWMDKGYFRSVPDEREPFTIVIPPPNVTGVLHMGHMLNNTIQDILIRRARHLGKNACWVPGTDHASIATESKVVRWLREEKGLTKGDLTREEFLEYAWEWTEKYGGIILKQLRKLGASCDWERTSFTMDKERSPLTIQAFVDLYRKGFLYRDNRMINWDPEAQTVVSNEEVLYSDEQANLYHVRYRVEGTDRYVVIATTRPETIMGDTAIAVHPEDERYKDLIGKKAIVPMIDRAIPIIADDYVEREFGTGALKVTPAHDPNDYEIGKRHDLETVDIFNPDGTLNDKAQIFIGMDRMEARVEVIKLLKKHEDLVHQEQINHSVGRSERTQAIIEPRLSLQWYVRMPDLAKPALDAVMDDTVKFYPERQKNTYRHWMENVRDWCISRQLWWGERIPAWYYEDQVYVAQSAEEALEEARAMQNNPNIQLDDLRQDEDVLDTWFSSWLWPMSVFGSLDGDNAELDYYYPTNVLVTGWDIIFLWVARMIISGYEWKDLRPFNTVYFTGMVRDQQRRKMSKSLGNSPDALGLIEKYGADGVRFGILSSSPAGGDLLFDEKLCEQGSKFCNKMWSALSLIKGRDRNSDVYPDGAQPKKDILAHQWFENKYHDILSEINQQYDQYRLSDVLMQLYSLIWNDFFQGYIEIVKPEGAEPFHDETYKQAVHHYEQLIKLLNPFMPFITEELWHQLDERKLGDDLIIMEYPESKLFDKEAIDHVQFALDLTTKIRDLRNKQDLGKNTPLTLYFEPSAFIDQKLADNGWVDLLKKCAVLDDISTNPEDKSRLIAIVLGTEKVYLDGGADFDVEAEIAKLQEELTYQQGFTASAEKKLGNERFVQNAPEQVVAKERQKLADGQARIALIQESLKNLGV